MSELFQNKYRIASSRLPGWDYGSQGTYFITACTRAREHSFGNIANGKMCLSEIGAYVYNSWLETPALRIDMNLRLGEFVVMPNHFHGILVIGNNEFNSEVSQIEWDTDSIPEWGDIDMEFRQNSVYKNSFAPQAKNLGSVMRGFKSSVTSFAEDLEIPFGWQGRFYDHIIRSYEEYLRISRYINTNIEHWDRDCFYS